MAENRQFSDLALYYDAIYKDKNYMKELVFLKSMVPDLLTTSGVALEVGCGTGGYTGPQSEFVGRVDAFDKSESMIKLANKTKGSGVIYSASDFQNFDLKYAYSRVFSLFHVASYLGANFERFLDFSRGALESSTSYSNDRRMLCFDFYDARGVEESPPQDNERQFYLEGEEYSRKVKVIEQTKDFLLLSIDILKAPTLEIVASEIHKLSIYNIEYIQSELKLRGFKILASLDTIGEAEYSGQRYGNCIIAELL